MEGTGLVKRVALDMNNFDLYKRA